MARCRIGAPSEALVAESRGGKSEHFFSPKLIKTVAGNTRPPPLEWWREVRAETLLTKGKKRLQSRKILETSSDGDIGSETAKSLLGCKAVSADEAEVPLDSPE